MTCLQRWLTIGGVAVLAFLAVGCNGDGDEEKATSPGIESGSSSVTTQVFSGTAGAATGQLLQVPPSGITVLGYGEASAKPDRAIVQLGVTSTQQYYGPGPPPAGPVAEEVMQHLVDALIKAGVNNDDIDANPNASSYLGSGTSALFTARIADPSKVEDVIDAFNDTVKDLEDDDEYSVQYANVRYTVQDCAPLEAKAREEALEDADARARGYADLMGASLGGLIAVSEVGAAGLYSPQSVASIGCRALEDVAPLGYTVSLPTETNTPEEATVTVTLSVTYAME